MASDNSLEGWPCSAFIHTKAFGICPDLLRNKNTLCTQGAFLMTFDDIRWSKDVHDLGACRRTTIGQNYLENPHSPRTIRILRKRQLRAYLNVVLWQLHVRSGSWQRAITCGMIFEDVSETDLWDLRFFSQVWLRPFFQKRLKAKIESRKSSLLFFKKFLVRYPSSNAPSNSSWV